ncbi:disks large-associated protein 5 isoform X1 [Conger conger]|uniref:disks large-associated protein 5 isoform X1 n=1 Tax=Conger conger TaxID=82655 RepID=UPI002A5A2FF7|nr:disks large-associated protein 5 isoform X1 [Conger conger]
METRFSHLYKRDSSVSMLRVKMARRRSQSQKENRDRAVNRHRRLDQLPELEASALEESVIQPPTAVSEGMAPGQKQVKSERSAAVEERMKMLARYKEAKDLQKEKERREREKKGGIFKVGLYKPRTLNILQQISSAPIRAKAPEPAPSSRVTRSMKQQVRKPVAPRGTAAVSRKVEPAVVRAPVGRAVGKPAATATSARGRAAPVEAVVRPASTRAATRSQAASLVGARKPAPDANVSKTRATNKLAAAPPIGRGKPAQGRGATRTQSRVQKSEEAAEVEEMDTGSAEPQAEAEQPREEEQEVQEEEEEEEKTEREKVPDVPSFAPQDFVFQAPSGLKSFQSVPLTPRSADAFLTPSYSDVPLALSFSPLAHRAPVGPPRPSPPPQAPVPLSGPQEPQHDVLYFRSVLVSETARLSALCEEWERRTEDPSVPEESQDRVRTAVGQARLLMKERFGQFQGLVDDCDLGRGEKVTTCTDLQGFWDMVFYQVEDVIRKFDVLREAESKGWQEERKSPPRPKKTKKPPGAAVVRKPGGGGGASAAARSRLAAVKAAMKARRAEAEPPAAAPPTPTPDPAQTVVFHGGFFRVESPARTPGASRRSPRRSAVPSLHGSPCPGSQLTTPRRTRPSAFAHPSPLPTLSLRTPTACTPHPKTQGQSPPQSPLPPLSLNDPTASTPPPEPALHAGAPSGRSEYDAEPTGTHSEPPEAASSQSQAVDRCAETGSQSELAPDAAERTASQSEDVTEMDSCVTPFPSLQAPTSEAMCQNSSLSPCQTADQRPAEAHGLSFSLSPCQTADQRPAEAHGLSFSLSPCPSGSAPPAVSASLPAPLGFLTPAACSTDSPTGSSEACLAGTPDISYTENTPGLDFERYLRPTLRRSPSPQPPAVAMETTSLLATPTSSDVHMDSPGPEPEQLSEGDSLGNTAPLAALGQAFPPQTQQLEEEELLLFTPELRDKVRQSVCGRDLMTFTPPCGR